MARKLHELSDDELSKLSSEELAAMAAAEDEYDGPDQGNDDNDDDAQADASLNAVDTNVVETPKDDANLDDDDDQDEAQKEAPANGAEVDKGASDKTVDAAKDGEKAPADTGKDSKTDSAKDAGVVIPPVVVDYEAEHKALLAPFKANGRDIQVADIGEARQLMQMGANYNKKMQAMKPHLATLRTLEIAKIGEAELSYLIDLHRKDPGAINKLVKESGIDPLDLSHDKAADYKPGNHKASDVEVELESVLADLDGSEGLPKTINIVTGVWDAKSKDTIAQNPQVLRLINAHVESGIYDLVATEIERKRTFGQLAGLSDFDAYRQVGDEMNANGKFAHLGGSSTKGQQTIVAQVIEAPNPKKADDDKRKEQKRGAASAKAAVPAATKITDFNPLSVSDEDFAKLTIKT